MGLRSVLTALTVLISIACATPDHSKGKVAAANKKSAREFSLVRRYKRSGLHVLASDEARSVRSTSPLASRAPEGRHSELPEELPEEFPQSFPRKVEIESALRDEVPSIRGGPKTTS